MRMVIHQALIRRLFVLVPVLLAVAFCLQPAGSDASPNQSVLAKPKCKTVKGKKVCPTVKPKPTAIPTRTPPPTPTATLSPTAVELKGFDVPSVLQTLEYTVYGETPADYAVQQRQFQGENRTVLWNNRDNRIDGMQITIDGKEQWIRGLYYKVNNPTLPKLGGVVYDGVFDDTKGRQGLTDPTQGPAYIFDALQHIIAKQKNIPFDQVPQYILDHNYQINNLVLPQVRTLSDGSRVPGSPSPLAPSIPMTLDLTQPVTFTLRSRSDTEGLDIKNIPPEKFITEFASGVRDGLFLDSKKGLHYATYSPDNLTILTSLGSGSDATSVFKILEAFAEMTPDFQDNLDSKSNLWLNTLRDRTGKNYKPGNTIIPEEEFILFDAAFTKITYSIFGPAS